MNNLDPKGEFNFILQELKATNQNNQLKKMRENQKAIECLEDVREQIMQLSGIVGHDWRIDKFKAKEIIDQKISELKGE